MCSVSPPTLTPRPDLLDFESLKKCNAHYNLQNAFNLAEKELGLTKLLDPEGGSELCKTGVGKTEANWGCQGKTSSSGGMQIFWNQVVAMISTTI